MANGISPAGAPPQPASGEYRYARDATALASYIYQSIPLHLEAHDGQMDYDDLTEQIIKLIKTLEIPNPAELRTFLDTLSIEFTKRVASLDFPNNRTYAPIFNRLMLALRKQLFPQDTKIERPRIADAYENRTFLNSTQVNVWNKLGANGGINAGVFRSGDAGTALSQYVSYIHEWYSLDHALLKARVRSGLGVFSLMPAEDMTNRYVAGVVPSVAAFAGSDYALPWGFRLRGAAELRTSLPVGFHLPVDFYSPIEFGAAVARHLSAVKIAVGAKLQILPVVKDVQDATSEGLAHESTQWFARMESPYVDLRVSVDLYSNERFGRLQLSKSVPFAGGIGTAALIGQSALKADWVSAMPNVFLALQYEQRTANYHVKARTSLDFMVHDEEIYSRTKPGIGFDPDQVSAASAQDFEGRAVTCTSSGANKMQCAITGLKDPLLDCRSLNNSVTQVECHQYGPNKSFDRIYTLNTQMQQNKVVGVVGTATLSSQDPVLNAFVANPTRAGFVKSFKAMSSEAQLGTLQQAMATSYKTYNGMGMAVLTGDETVNEIDPDKIYEANRNYYLHPEAVDKTTVCRGIAKFIAGLAAEVGYESHAIGIRTGRLWHSVVLMRKPGEEYIALNGGPIENTGHYDVAGALVQFANQNGYPPQLKFIIFDHNGRYERTIQTNEGRLLDDATVAPAELDHFLEFR